MALNFLEHRFADRGELARALAGAVAARLAGAIAESGRATVALSGGTTPRRFLRELSQQSIDWPRVTVTPCDERWVPPDHERSNERLVREQLLRGKAAAAKLVSLYADFADPEDAAAEIGRRVGALPRPFDAVVLGLGNDGHTASWFPGGDHLAQALDPQAAIDVLPMRAPGAGEPRITLTLPPIAAARALFLHIEGAEKQRVFAAIVRGDGALAASPLRTLLENAHARLDVYWSA